MATTKPATTFSGLATGIDSASLIDSMVTLAKIPVTRITEKQSVNTKVSKKFTDLKTKLAALKTAAAALDTRKEAQVNKATSSTETVAKAVTTGGATVGSFTIVVTSLAAAGRTYSDPQTSASTAGVAGSGLLQITVGDGTVGVTIDPTDTLDGIATKINAASAGVTAGVMYDGTSYRLQVTATAVGAANQLSFVETPGLTLGLSNTDPQHVKQAASDAVFTIDGFPASATSNNVTNAIPGVTLSLTGPGTTELKIERDPDGLKTKIDAFAAAYNDINKFMNAEFAYTGTQKAADSLSGDGGLRGIQTELRKTLGADLSSLTASFGTLADLGVTQARDGTMSVDATKLTAAVTKDYEGVAAIFAGGNGADGLMARFTDMVDRQTDTDGAITLRINSLTARNTSLTKDAERIQNRIDKYEQLLQRQFAALESLTAGLQSQGNALISTLNAM